jgi:hypothetical protein
MLLDRKTGQGQMNKAEGHASNKELRSEGGIAAPGRLSDRDGRPMAGKKSRHPFEAPS